MPDIKDPLDQLLYDLIIAHLAKLKQYVPGPVKKAGGTRKQLLARYRNDPLYSIFGLDSPEYIAAGLGGGTITSIHRKLGDIYEQSVATIFAHTLGISAADLSYSATIQEETRSADVYIQFDQVKEAKQRKAITEFCAAELAKLTKTPKVTLIGLGMEVRHCYQTGDSKRTQADEAMARHLLVSGIRTRSQASGGRFPRKKDRSPSHLAGFDLLFRASTLENALFSGVSTCERLLGYFR